MPDCLATEGELIVRGYREIRGAEPGLPDRQIYVIISRNNSAAWAILQTETEKRTKEVLNLRLKDKVAIITGGSPGIGFATADKFLKESATVILAASSQSSADKAVAQLREKYSESTVAGISPDLSSLESVREAFREATGKYGCVDILVNNAVYPKAPLSWNTRRTPLTRS